MSGSGFGHPGGKSVKLLAGVPPMSYKTYVNLEELETEWKRLQTVTYEGESGILLEEIRKIYPKFIPVSESEIYYRGRQLGLTTKRIVNK